METTETIATSEQKFTTIHAKVEIAQRLKRFGSQLELDSNPYQQYSPAQTIVWLLDFAEAKQMEKQVI